MTITIIDAYGNSIIEEPGCYIDGHWGQYGPDRLAEIIEGYGYEFGTEGAPDVEDDPRYWRRAAEAETSEDTVIIRDGNHHRVASAEECWEHHVGAADRLEEFLNEHTSGGYWEWQDGEFFLVQTEVEGFVYIVAKDYEEAWEILRDNGPSAGYVESEPALEYADDEGLKVWNFRITVHYEPED